MKPNIHPELYRAMQTAREEDISRVATRLRAEGASRAERVVARCGRVAAFVERALRDASATLFGQDSPTNMGVNVPPLSDNPSLPEVAC